MAKLGADFFESYNRELEQFGCGVKVAAPVDDWHAGSICIVDLDGSSIGIVPRSTEPMVLAAFMRIIERTYEQGVADGRRYASETPRHVSCPSQATGDTPSRPLPHSTGKRSDAVADRE